MWGAATFVLRCRMMLSRDFESLHRWVEVFFKMLEFTMVRGAECKLQRFWPLFWMEWPSACLGLFWISSFNCMVQCVYKMPWLVIWDVWWREQLEWGFGAKSKAHGCSRNAMTCHSEQRRVWKATVQSDEVDGGQLLTYANTLFYISIVYWAV